MSPANQGVFQLLKEVTFRGILTFYSSYSDSDNLIRDNSGDDSVCLERHSKLENLNSGMYILLSG